MATNINELVETLSQLTVLDMAKLKTALEEKWGVKAVAAAVPVALSAVSAAGGEAATEAATDFKITLEEAPPDKKIAIIKIVREVTDLGLKEAKELVEGAPKVLKESSPKEEAEGIQKKIATAGGKVSLKGL